MSLSGADETPEFASRITYEAREDLAKDGTSQLPRAISTDNDDDDDDEDNDGDDGDDDDERRLARHAHVVGASAAATTAELRGCLPRRTAPGGLQRLRHPTSPAILHRACASKAAYTPPPTLPLPFSPSFSLSYFIPHSRVSRDPRFAPLAAHPPRYLPARAHFEGAYTSICRIRVSRLSPSLFREGRRGSIPRPPFQPSPLCRPSPPSSRFPLSFFLMPLCLRALALLVLTHFLFIPLLRRCAASFRSFPLWKRGGQAAAGKSSISATCAWYCRKLDVA